MFERVLEVSVQVRGGAESGHFVGMFEQRKDLGVGSVRAQSVLGSAAEEITFAHADKAEDKALEERVLTADVAAEVLTIEQISVHLDAARDGDRNALEAVAKKMLQAPGSSGQMAGAFSRDPTRQFLALQLAMVFGRRDGASEDAIRALREAVVELLMEHGSGIRADLNTVQAAAGFCDSAESIAGFQRTYRDVVLGQQALDGILKILLDRAGGDGGEAFGSGLSAMIRAVGDDLSAARPSIEPTRLRLLAQDLYLLQVVGTLLGECGQMASLLSVRHGIAPFSPVQLMLALVSLVGQRWVGEAAIAAIAERFGARALSAKIRFLMAVKGVYRGLPVKVFSDDETRDALMQAVQEALDKVVAEEEEG